MKNFLDANISWLYKYFKQNKSLLEIFSLFVITQSFLYGTETKDISSNSIAAFKIVFWIFIFLILFLLAVKTTFDIREEDGQITRSIFKGASLMKNVVRLLTFTLFLASIPVVVHQLQASVHNRLFFYFWLSLIIIGISEVVAFITALFLYKK